MGGRKNLVRGFITEALSCRKLILSKDIGRECRCATLL